MVSVFFSYSHKDEDLRDELEVHLAALKRQGVIEAWHDRRIGVGKDLPKVIDAHLEEAEIVLLLVSPDFIASDYCYDVEMSRAMERHKSGHARVVPVILRPCDWHDTPFGKLLAVPKDGMPIMKYPSRDDAFLEIALAVREAAEDIAPTKMTSAVATEPSSVVVQEVTRSSNLGIRKNFSDRDRDSFLRDTFEYMVKFFDSSLAELNKRYDEIEINFRLIDANIFTASIYRNGQSVSHCQVRFEEKTILGSGTAGIAYSIEGHKGGYNEIINVVDGANALFLRPSGMFSLADSSGQLSQQGAAEYYWSRLIEPLQK